MPLLVQLLLCIGTGIGSYFWRQNIGLKRPHLALDVPDRGNWTSARAYIPLVSITAWILYSHMVPISLFVTMEIVKFTQALVYINRDPNLRQGAKALPSEADLSHRAGSSSSSSIQDHHCSGNCSSDRNNGKGIMGVRNEQGQARNSSLNEDLGRVSYIFSDKTGTLTRNDMRLRQIGMWGICFGQPPDVLRLEEAHEEAGMGAQDMEGEGVKGGKGGLAAQQQQQQQQQQQGDEASVPQPDGARGLGMLWRWDARLAQACEAALQDGSWQAMVFNGGSAALEGSSSSTTATTATTSSSGMPATQGSTLASGVLDLMLAILSCNTLIVDPPEAKESLLGSPGQALRDSSSGKAGAGRTAGTQTGWAGAAGKPGKQGGWLHGGGGGGGSSSSSSNSSNGGSGSGSGSGGGSGIGGGGGGIESQGEGAEGGGENAKPGPVESIADPSILDKRGCQELGGGRAGGSGCSSSLFPPNFQGPSPDEVALADGAWRVGFALVERGTGPSNATGGKHTDGAPSEPVHSPAGVFEPESMLSVATGGGNQAARAPAPCKKHVTGAARERTCRGMGWGRGGGCAHAHQPEASTDTLRLCMLGSWVVLELLNCVEFSGERKRMAVVVRAPSGRLLAFVKGADAAIIPLLRGYQSFGAAPEQDGGQVEGASSSQAQLEPVSLAEGSAGGSGANKSSEGNGGSGARSSGGSSSSAMRGQAEAVQHALASVDAFSQQGLRTLVVAGRALDEGWYERWDAEYQKAAAMVEYGGAGESEMERLAGELECDLQLLGVTAVEDTLQDGVPQALQALQEAGIRISVITGDKREVAVNIAMSTSLFKPAALTVRAPLDPASLHSAMAWAADKAHARTPPQPQTTPPVPLNIAGAYVAAPPATAHSAPHSPDPQRVMLLSLDARTPQGAALGVKQLLQLVRSTQRARGSMSKVGVTAMPATASSGALQQQPLPQQQLWPAGSELSSPIAEPDSTSPHALGKHLLEASQPTAPPVLSDSGSMAASNLQVASCYAQKAAPQRARGGEAPDTGPDQHAATLFAAGAPPCAPLLVQLVVDGHSLSQVLQVGDQHTHICLAELFSRCSAVLVCRASPAQKASVVRLMRDYLTKSMRFGSALSTNAGSPYSELNASTTTGTATNTPTSMISSTSSEVAVLARPLLDALRALKAPWKSMESGLKAVCRGGRQLLQLQVSHPVLLAIGDGANDVSMLQVADVGVGLLGKEGRQAANSADYVIVEFRHLVPLLLVHGSLCRHRLARLTSYSFYKNMVFWAVLFLFQPFCGWSGQTLVDDISGAVFNVVFTSVPVLVYALSDRPAPDHLLLAHPHLYKSINASSRGAALRPASFWRQAIGLGALHGAVAFFIPFLSQVMYGVQPVNGLWALGKTVYTAMLGAITLDLVATTNYWTWPLFWALVLSYGLFFPFMALYPHAAFSAGFMDTSYIGLVPGPLLATPHYWLSILAVYFATFGARVAAEAGHWLYWPSATMRLLKQQKREQQAVGQWDEEQPHVQ